MLPMLLTEQEIEDNSDAFFNYYSSEEEMKKKYIECNNLPIEQQLEYMKLFVLNYSRAAEEVNNIINNITANLTLLEIVKRLAGKSRLIFEEKFERLYLNFQQKIEEAEYFGLKKDDIFFSETEIWKSQLGNERNILLLQLSKEKMSNVLKKIEYYTTMLNLNISDQTDSDEVFNHFINPTPNDFRENDNLPIFEIEGLEELVERGDKLSNKFTFLFKSIAQEILLLSFQKEYFERIKEFKKRIIGEENTLEIESSKELSVAQKVLSIMLIHKFYRFSKSQDRIDLQNYIHVITGNNHRKIGDFMAKFNEENFCLFHTTKKQNLEDYKAVKKYFEKMESTEIIQFIDNQIIMIKKLIQ